MADPTGSEGTFPISGGITVTTVAAANFTVVPAANFTVVAPANFAVQFAPTAASMWRLSTSFATVGPITVAAAGSAGQTTYVSGLQITNTGTTASRLTFNDTGTSTFSIPGSTATTAVPVNLYFAIPLVSNTTATTLVGTLSALSTSVFVSLQGWYQ